MGLESTFCTGRTSNGYNLCQQVWALRRAKEEEKGDEKSEERMRQQESARLVKMGVYSTSSISEREQSLSPKYVLISVGVERRSVRTLNREREREWERLLNMIKKKSTWAISCIHWVTAKWRRLQWGDIWMILRFTGPSANTTYILCLLSPCPVTVQHNVSLSTSWIPTILNVDTLTKPKHMIHIHTSALTPLCSDVTVYY